MCAVEPQVMGRRRGGVVGDEGEGERRVSLKCVCRWKAPAADVQGLTAVAASLSLSESASFSLSLLTLCECT